MIIDTHTHLFPESVKNDRDMFFNNEPEFKMLYNSPRAKISTAREMIESMDIHGVDITVASGFPWRNPDFAKKNNDYILETVLSYPGRIKGLACFDLTWEGAADEAVRCIDAGLSGVGELAFYLSGIDKKALKLLEPVMEVLRTKGNILHRCSMHRKNWSIKT
ncbi:MAG: hypothetical protein B6230_03620 [Desulfobacteraceae bacterium 4572_89]|nr:MAG: hypothetical protein B6230_03620 [Desulfobacteraceae bacterium 4572_89]